MRMRWIIASLLVALFVFPTMIDAQQDRGQRVVGQIDIVALPSSSKRWALLIGVNKYDSKRIPSLIGAANDAHKLADALVKHAGFPREQVIVLSSSQTDEDLHPKRNTILEQLANLNGLVPPDGLFLFAFSGHGVEAKEKGYLLPADAVTAERNVRLLEKTAISVEDVKDEIKRYGVRQVMVLLDSCRDDPRDGKAVGDNLMGTTLASSFDFDRLNSNIEGFITFYATSPKMRAYEDRRKKQGYFSLAFIEALSGGAANERGEVTLANLIKYLEKNVPDSVRRGHGGDARQEPRLAIEGFRATELVLAVTAPPVVRLDPGVAEIAFWNSIANSNAIEDFDAYLEQYPNGQFAGLARNRRNRLRLKTDNPPPDPRGEEKTPRPVRLVSFITASLVEGGIRKSQAECEIHVEDLSDGVKIELVRIRGGQFRMGSPENEAGRLTDESPAHDVTVSDFLLGRYEVTQKQWRAVAKLPRVRIGLKANPSRFKGEQLPVEQVNWDEAKEFIARLNRKLGLTEQTGYRLPSEAEWEYAARAQTRTTFAFGPTIMPEIVNYGSVRKNTVEVGHLGVASPFGLFDMHGNVREWCEDDWHADYEGAPSDGRAWVDGPIRNTRRVFRGGGWDCGAVLCRSANRDADSPDYRYDGLGFRILKAHR